MTTSLSRLPDKFILMWDQRFVRLLGGRPLVAALIAAIILFASFVVLAFAAGIYGRMNEGHIPEIARTFGLDPYTWAALVSSLLSGFAVSAASFALINEERDIRQAAPLVGKEPDVLVEAWLDYQRARIPRGRVIGALFYLIGFAVVLVNIPGASDLLRLNDPIVFPWFQQVPAVWFMVVVPVNFAIIGKSAYFTISDEFFQRDLRVAHLEIDLFRPERFAPFNRMALRRAFLWIIGSSIGLLFFLNDAIEPDGLAPFLVAILLVAVATLFAPLIGIHRKISAAKRAEIEKVRDVIVRLKDDLMSGAGASGEAAQRLTGLIAYEARLEKVSEWPIDLPTLGRFTLYLGIPVFSWIGGALVERVVDLLL